VLLLLPERSCTQILLAHADLNSFSLNLKRRHIPCEHHSTVERRTRDVEPESHVLPGGTWSLFMKLLGAIIFLFRTLNSSLLRFALKFLISHSIARSLGSIIQYFRIAYLLRHLKIAQATTAMKQSAKSVSLHPFCLHLLSPTSKKKITPPPKTPSIIFGG